MGFLLGLPTLASVPVAACIVREACLTAPFVRDKIATPVALGSLGTEEDEMSEENKALVRRAYDAMNSGDFASLDEIISDTFVEHEEMPGVAPTKEGVLQYFKAMRDAFGDFRMSLDDMIAEGDKVFLRGSMSGTHNGEFMGIPATGKKINVPMGDFLRIDNGKVVEHWGVTDSGAMMQQLGMVESPG